MTFAMPEKDAVPARGGSDGFSLIEILIATTILLVIVILASMVFQQTTGAYQTGERKVNAQVALRNVLGAITRDLAMAVDSSKYDGLDVNSFNGGSSITFLALTGTPGEDENGNVVRTARKITYSYSGGVVRRAEQGTTCDGGIWSTIGNVVEADLNSPVDCALSDFEFTTVGSGALPKYVKIRAEISTEEMISSVGAGSGGKSGWREPGKDDDNIYVGFKPDNL